MPPAAALLGFYRTMVRARAFELLLAALWRQGAISGEMHLGTGEEAVAAGVAAHVEDGDAVALDHRPTPVLIARGVEPRLLLEEMLGREEGLCRGRGGHMHLFSPDHLAASSGIVGASAPQGAGFALAARALRPGRVAVAFFGEGAANQGMLLETLNLAVVWLLPLVFVCKDNGWAITSRSALLTGGDLVARAQAFGMHAEAVDGGDITEVAEAAGEAVARARGAFEPTFLLMRCPRLDGHLLGDPLVRMARSPVREGAQTFAQVGGAVLARRGGTARTRAASLAAIMARLRHAGRSRREGPDDPLQRARALLPEDGAEEVERAVHDELARLIEATGVEVEP